ncbi:MAG: flagellar biosynthetic protein FliO [Ectothiorhodospiraceae bacterium]|jgi:flagellar protein FliO/FliZ
MMPALRRIPAAVVALLTTPAALAAEKGAAPTSGVDVSSLVRLILALAAVIGVIFLLSWLLKRMGGVSGGVSGKMRVLGGLSVGNRERVVLVQVGEKQLLLGVAPGRVQTLHVLDEPIEVGTRGENAPAQGAFADRLRRIMQQGGGQ